tara:strand:+ start:563 stop:1273 length:711 start_codon:yes stop_codon:yes gene_type:complete
MKYIFNQFQGLGDILFCEPIAKYYYNGGENEIVWPILPEFLWLQEYFPYITFTNQKEYVFPYESTFFGQVGTEEFQVPLRFANPIVRKLSAHDYSDQLHTMLDKYRMVGLSEDLWRTMTWNRNVLRENALYSSLIESSKYILVNNTWSDGTLDIQPNNPENHQIVKMEKIAGYTMLDWAKVIENAEQIYTVSTSNLFLIETLPIKASSVTLYPRLPRENTFDGILELVDPDFNLIL